VKNSVPALRQVLDAEPDGPTTQVVFTSVPTRGVRGTQCRRQGRAIALQVVERVTAVEHDLDECVKRVLDSPAACRHVLRGLLEPARLAQLDREARWDAVRTQVLHVAGALLNRERARRLVGEAHTPIRLRPSGL
jgi:hypothetical protein